MNGVRTWQGMAGEVAAPVVCLGEVLPEQGASRGFRSVWKGLCVLFPPILT